MPKTRPLPALYLEGFRQGLAAARALVQVAAEAAERRQALLQQGPALEQERTLRLLADLDRDLAGVEPAAVARPPKAPQGDQA